MEYEGDFILRQIKTLADGLGVALAHGKNGGQTEIIFPAALGQKLPFQPELQGLITQQHYAQAAHRLLQLRYALPENEFLKLGVWFYGQLNQLSADELAAGRYSKQNIVAGLRQLEQLKAELK